jgi:hypothetical protein
MSKSLALCLMLLAGLSLAACDQLSRPLTKQPPTATPIPDVVFVGAGDIAQCDSKDLQKNPVYATAQMVARIPGTVFTAGDNAYPSGSATQFQNCYQPTWGQFKDRTLSSPGNHDYQDTPGDAYYSFFGNNAGEAGQGYYSVDLGVWHIIMLNSNIPAGAGSPQEKWLRSDLAGNRKTCTLAIWHHPLYSSGEHGNNGKFKDLWQALYEHHATVVVNGHDHDYERFAPQDPNGKADPVRGIREFVVGTGGADLRNFNQIRDNSEVRDSQTFGVIRFTLRPTSYDWQFIPAAGGTFTDQGTAACSVG